MVPRFLCLMPALLFAASLVGQEPAVDHSTWDEWLLPLGEFPSGQPQAASCRLYVREVGEGPRVVLLHGGWGGEHGYLLDGFLSLADRFRLVFYDQRGSARSPCGEPPTVQDHVADLERLRETLGEERLMLVAHSMGGWLAMQYAADHPRRISGLALLAPTPARSSDDVRPTQDEWMDRWTRPAVIEELERLELELDRPPHHTPQQWSTNHRVIFGATNLHDVTRWHRLRPPWLHSEEAGRSAASSMPEEWDLTEALKSLSIPVLVVAGESDYIATEGHRRWTARVPNARFAEIPQAGHVLWVDRPEIIEELVRPYLEELLAEGRNIDHGQ